MPDSPTPARSRPTLIQVCLVVLPLGTIILGIIAMIWYFQKDYIVGKSDRDGVYTKEPTVASIGDYTSKLTSTITAVRGTRDEAGRRGMLATQSMIEGALGETNMGYNPVVQTFEGDGFTWKNIWADNTGTRNPSEIIEVRVPYVPDGTTESINRNSLAVAVGLELAHAFTGTATRRTVRFLFLGGATGETGDVAGAGEYARLMADRRIKVVGVLDLSRGDFEPGRYINGNGLIAADELAAKVEDLRKAIARLAGQ